MRALFFIPFLAAPFFLPEIPSGIRIASLLAVGIAAFAWLSPVGGASTKPVERLSPFQSIALIGVFLLYFSIGDPWYRHCVWPAAVSGVLMMLALSRNTLLTLWGLAVTGIVLWFLIYLLAVYPAFLPLEHFSILTSQAYPLSSLILDSGIALPAAIVTPKTCAEIVLFQMAATITTTLFVALGFRRTKSPFRFLLWVPLAGWCLISLPVLGITLFILLAAIVSIFLALTGSLHSLLTKKTILSFIPFLLFCVLGYWGFLDRALHLLTPIYDMLDRLIPQFASMHPFSGFPIESLFYDEKKMGTDWVIPAIIGIGLLLLIIETGFSRQRDDLRYPAGISLLVLSGLSIGPSLHIWLVNPLTWIALSCLQNARRIKPEREKESGIGMMNVHWMPWAAAGFAGFLSLFAAWNLYPHWLAEKDLQQFALSLQSGGSRSNILASAFQRTPYRGDIAALYVTESIMTLYPKGALPPAPEPAKLESILNLAAKQGFIPLLGYARLSGLYFLHGQREQSLGILLDSVRISPGQFAMQELLADSLETLDRKEQALRHYQLCANLVPTLARIREKMARIYLSQGKKDEATQENNNLLTLDPTWKWKLQ